MKNLLFILILLITACVPVTPVPGIEADNPQQTPNPAQLRTSLELYRNGKTYSLLLGEPGSENTVSGARIDWSGNLDDDSETEYLVTTFSPVGDLCYQTVQVFDYLPALDEFRAVAEISDHCAAFESIEDIEKDGSPELLGRDSAFNFALGGSSETISLSPLKVYRYQQEMFEDVTAQYPDLIEKDAVQFLTEAKKGYGHPDLALAAYLADTSLLGKQDEGVENFMSVCKEYVKPTMKSPDWSCEKFLEQVQEAISAGR